MAARCLHGTARSGQEQSSDSSRAVAGNSDALGVDRQTDETGECCHRGRQPRGQQSPQQNDGGKGNQELGAPNLTDGIWLFGSDEATIIEVITKSRGGVMPAWAGRLDPITIKALAYYVHSLGGGEK